MKSEKNSGTSKRKKNKAKEVKLTAAERRRLQREREREEAGEESRFSAFETSESRGSKKRSSQEERDRFSNFDSGKPEKEERDDYFERLYGSAPSLERKERSSEKGSGKKASERKKERRDHSEKQTENKTLTKEQRKFRTVLSYIIVFAVIVAVGAVLSLTVMFRTTNIVVQGGDMPYSSEEIIEASGLKYSENIFMSKKKLAVKKIVDKYPYIENAEISVKIPGTQIISLEVATPSFQLAVSDGFAIVSANNRVLEISESQRVNIPLLKGLKLTDTRVGQYINFEKSATEQILTEVISNINENAVPNIYGIDISNSANIKLNYDNRITILIGVPEDVGYKLRTAMTIINSELSATDKGELDVSLASSDRKSSYFTPIYSNTVSVDDSTSASGSTYSSSGGSGDNTVKNADEYFNRNSSGTSLAEEDDYNYIYDIIDDDEFEYDEGDTSQNIISDYGTNYYW